MTTIHLCVCGYLQAIQLSIRLTLHVPLTCPCDTVKVKVKSTTCLCTHKDEVKAQFLAIRSPALQRCRFCKVLFNPLTPNDHYKGRTALLTSNHCILYIYSTNIGTEFLNMVYTLRFFSSKCSLFHNSNLFGSCIIHILYTGCAKIKKK